MPKFSVSRLFAIIYIIIGLFVAWERGYLGIGWLRAVGSAIIAIFLWWLVLLGVNVHITA
jgi:hypothetical protein